MKNNVAKCKRVYVDWFLLRMQIVNYEHIDSFKSCAFLTVIMKWESKAQREKLSYFIITNLLILPLFT